MTRVFLFMYCLLDALHVYCVSVCWRVCLCVYGVHVGGGGEGDVSCILLLAVCSSLLFN